MKFLISRQSGLTLVELMIAMVIATLVALAVSNIFISNKVSSLFQVELSRLQEKGRFALDTIIQDLRLFENWGCIDDSADIRDHTGSFDVFNPIKINNNLSPLTDDISIIGAVTLNQNVAVVADGFSAENPVPLNVNPSTFGRVEQLVGSPVLIADCHKGDIVQVTAINDSSLVHNQILSKSYNKNAFLYRAFNLSYKVEDGSLIRSYNGISSVIVDGVTDFQLQYGLDDPESPAFETAIFKPDVSGNELGRIASIRINLLLESEQDVLPKENTFEQETGGTIVDFNWDEKLTMDPESNTKLRFNDKKIRKTFTSIVALRNRI